MLRKIITGLFLACTALPAAAFEIENMTPDQRSIFRAEIRDFLLENPEILMESIGILEQRRANQALQQEKRMLQENQSRIFNDGISWVAGNPDGDVTIVEFLDYRCGYCKRAHPDMVELLNSDTGVKLIVKEFPILGEESEIAARFAIATMKLEGDEMYAKVHDALMTWNGPMNPGALARIARSAGVADQDAVLEMMNSEDVTAVIAENRALAEALNIQGTPSFIMGEDFVRGFVNIDQMRDIIEDIRAEQG